MEIKAHLVISIFWILKKKSDVSDYCKLTMTALIIWKVILFTVLPLLSTNKSTAQGTQTTAGSTKDKASPLTRQRSVVLPVSDAQAEFMLQLPASLLCLVHHVLCSSLSIELHELITIVVEYLIVSKLGSILLLCKLIIKCMSFCM